MQNSAAQFRLCFVFFHFILYTEYINYDISPIIIAHSGKKKTKPLIKLYILIKVTYIYEKGLLQISQCKNKTTWKTEKTSQSEC